MPTRTGPDVADDIARVVDKIREVVVAMKEAAQLAIEAEVEQVKEEMREGAPVESGNLRNKIIGEVDKDGKGGRVASTADYSQYVVNGTSERKANDFITPVAEKSRRRYPDRVREEIKRALGEVVKG